MQNYQNHPRLVPLYHFILSLVLLAAIIGSFVNLFDSWHNHNNLYSASLICLILFILTGYYILLRSFPLKAQDRAIRAEENLRHYALTGRLLDGRLRMPQILALRFAPDEEFIALCKKAVEENMTMKEIKKSIKNWKGDYYRV